MSGTPLLSNKCPLNVKARELMEQVDVYFRTDQLHVVRLANWGLEQVLGFGEAELESNDLAHAVLELLMWTEAKAAMKFLLKDRNLPDQMYTVLELQRMFLETDDPELGAVIILQLIARGAVKETADLVVSEHLQEQDPQEILMLLQNSRQSEEKHLTPLVESTALASINSPDVSSKQKASVLANEWIAITDYYNRGLAKHRLGQYEAAIDDYDNAIRLKPDNANAYYDRGLAKKKLGQTAGAKQDWRTALKLATQAGNVYLKNRLENVLQQSAGFPVKLNFKPKEEKVIQYSEDQIKDIVADYFKSLPPTSLGYSVKREYTIQMGSSQRRADIAFLRNGKLVAIVECKRTGRVENGNEQLKS
ncbi:tetratricopeptide repeat protein, partial [Candidatus Poribacteria bacterium]|nr:tetratricopeptide repeat protein [Candidatus Poribacteria bacterium]